MIFQLPYIKFPEAYTPGTMVGYDLLRGYLHSRTLRWSYGETKGRGTDPWYRATAVLPPGELVRELKTAGFAGIYIDRNGYPNRNYERALAGMLGREPLVSENE